MVFVYKKLAQFAVRCALPPRRSESPVCATDNKPSCLLHLLGWFTGSCGFSSLERRPEFWVLQYIDSFLKQRSYHLKGKEGSTWSYIWGEKQRGGLMLTFISGHNVSKNFLLSKRQLFLNKKNALFWHREAFLFTYNKFWGL